MENKYLDLVNNYYPLTKQDIGEFANIKVGVMKFNVEKYDAKDFGNVSLMKCSGMFGLMKMDTIVINPFKRDMTLFSYDYINAMGNDTLLVEQYDTLLDKTFRDTINDKMINLVKGFNKVSDEPYESQWYDSLYLNKVSFKKKNKKVKDYFEQISLEYLAKYLELSKDAKVCDEALKIAKAREYTEGLLGHGGPSTNVFKKKKGQEFTERFFREVLFATK